LYGDILDAQKKTAGDFLPFFYVSQLIVIFFPQRSSAVIDIAPHEMDDMIVSYQNLFCK
jgi:hypothetical protein